MRKNMFLSGTSITLLILAGYFIAKPKPVVVGYCPTMSAYVFDLEKKGNSKLVAYNSSQEALTGLANKLVDCVVIGRKANSNEITDNTLSKQFDRSATTLVKNINTSDSQAYLLSWEEVDYSQVELVVLTDEHGRKLAQHRTPFLYYSNQTSEKQIKQIVSLIGEKI